MAIITFSMIVPLLVERRCQGPNGANITLSGALILFLGCFWLFLSLSFLLLGNCGYRDWLDRRDEYNIPLKTWGTKLQRKWALFFLCLEGACMMAAGGTLFVSHRGHALLS